MYTFFLHFLLFETNTTMCTTIPHPTWHQCVFLRLCVCRVCVWNIKKRRELKIRRFVRENLVYYVHTDEKICKSTSVKIKHIQAQTLTHTHVHTHRSKWGWQVIYERHFPHTCVFHVVYVARRYRKTRNR